MRSYLPLLSLLALLLGLTSACGPARGGGRGSDDDDSAADDDDAGVASDDDDDASDDDDVADDDDDAAPDDDDVADDDDAAGGDLLGTCSATGGLTLGISGTVPCDGEFDWYSIEVQAGDCIHISADNNNAGAADLRALALDSDLVGFYGLAKDYSQLDDEAPCTTDTWNGFACPAASVVANNAGSFRIGVGQWGGDDPAPGCTDGAGYTIHFAVNGTATTAEQTHDDTTLEAFFEAP
jgi:hypothetical protein